LFRDLIDKAAPALFVAHQALGCQHLERLTQRGARYLKLLSDRHFIDERARQQGSREDQVPQPRSDFVVE
jgi:hypothetical protein